MTELIFEPPKELTDEILDRLEAHNTGFYPGGEFEANLAVVERDSQGELIAGAYGRLSWGYLYIDCLWVAESARGRGLGRKILRAMEEAAQDQGYRRIWLWTTSFQALDFYRAEGFAIFGELPDRPPGSVTYFLTKQEMGD